MKRPTTYFVLCALFMTVVWAASAQAPRQAAPAIMRWQYAKMDLLTDANGSHLWTVSLPGGRSASGEKVSDLAKKLNVPESQEGLLGMYNLMGSMGFEMVAETKGIDGITAYDAIFKRPFPQ